MSLQSNTISHWLGANLESTLKLHFNSTHSREPQWGYFQWCPWRSRIPGVSLRDEFGAMYAILPQQCCTTGKLENIQYVQLHSLHRQDISNHGIDSWPSNAIWRLRSGSILIQVMVWCPTAPSHYQNQCWLIISKAQWHSYKENCTREYLSHQALKLVWNLLMWNFIKNLPRANELTNHD